MMDGRVPHCADCSTCSVMVGWARVLSGRKCTRINRGPGETVRTVSLTAQIFENWHESTESERAQVFFDRGQESLRGTQALRGVGTSIGKKMMEKNGYR